MPTLQAGQLPSERRVLRVSGLEMLVSEIRRSRRRMLAGAAEGVGKWRILNSFFDRVCNSAIERGVIVVVVGE